MPSPSAGAIDDPSAGDPWSGRSPAVDEGLAGEGHVRGCAALGDLDAVLHHGQGAMRVAGPAVCRRIPESPPTPPPSGSGDSDGSHTKTCIEHSETLPVQANPRGTTMSGSCVRPRAEARVTERATTIRDDEKGARVFCPLWAKGECRPCHGP